MARDTQSIVKQSRREGYALHPKAARAMAKKAAAPVFQSRGRHSQQSQYAIQLREKQKVKRIYGLLEKPFANLMKEASRVKGQSGQTLLQFLERRADNAVYRAGFAPSRRAARQLVTHGHFSLNGKSLDIPSQRLAIGDIMTVKQRSIKTEYFKNIDTVSPSTQEASGWLKVDRSKLTLTVTGLPTREDAEAEIKEQLIVEYYSR